MFGAHHSRVRFIPTRVGNTGLRRLAIPQQAVHPHACGEHLIMATREMENSGSSPRVWGTHIEVKTARAVWRFIPTRVGNTISNAFAAVKVPVHPHACGEHQLTYSRCIMDNGSSPRVWGTQRRLWLLRLVTRFIPTRVGNTGEPIKITVAASVHPHACGEHFGKQAFVSIGSGSSPRVWGTLIPCSSEGGVYRFIPTRVGNTWRSIPQGR